MFFFCRYLLFILAFFSSFPIQSCGAQDLALDYLPSDESQLLPFEKIHIQRQDGSRIDFQVEVALNPEEQRIGLMNRPRIPEGTGMLFVFEREAMRNFWMRNTKVSLDLLFMKRDGLIFHIHENAVPMRSDRISSEGGAYAVLEIGGGEALRLQLEPGDRIISYYFDF